MGHPLKKFKKSPKNQCNGILVYWYEFTCIYFYAKFGLEPSVVDFLSAGLKLILPYRNRVNSQVTFSRKI